MTTYDEKVTIKKERYAELAEKKKREADQKYQASKQIADQIPFGQPILVGHHSEKRHRKLISSIHSNMRASIELDKKAEYYAKKAETYGSNMISSEDPNALLKLQEKLKDAQKEHDILKQARKEGLAEAYQLRNSNRRIQEIKKRMTTLEKMQQRVSVSFVGEGWEIYEEDSRFQYKSDTVPDENVRQQLKRRGFKWSPTRKAWVRLITPNALYSVKKLIQELTKK